MDNGSECTCPFGNGDRRIAGGKWIQAREDFEKNMEIKMNKVTNDLSDAQKQLEKNTRTIIRWGGLGIGVTLCISLFHLWLKVMSMAWK